MKRKKQVRKIPNVLITGTPGTGKTTLCEGLCDAYEELTHHNVSSIAIENKLLEGKDESRDTFIIDDDKVCDYLEEKGVDEKNDQGGHIVDYHGSSYFAERYFDLVIVLRTKIEVLAKRLGQRKYTKEKIRENCEAEIMQVCLDEAKSSYDKKIILELQNNHTDDMDNNVKKILGLIKQWESKH